MGLNVEDLEKLVGSEYMPIEIEPLSDDKFLIVKETLTRIGYTQVDRGGNNKTIYQTCHLLHKKGRYFICHFKQMYLFDGKIQHTQIVDIDISRLKYICNILTQWNLIKPLDLKQLEGEVTEVRILKHSEVSNWKMKQKYFNSFTGE